MFTTWLIQYSKYFGTIGCLFIILGVIIPGINYLGKKRERYSPLNHFISELGELGVSRNASIFNYSLILGGLLLIPFMIGLGLKLDSLWGKLASIAGVWASVSAICVGLFPMNNLEPHTKAAVSYFRGGLATVLGFGVAIQLQSTDHLLIPKTANLISLLTVISFSLFLLLLSRRWGKDENLDALNPQSKIERPRIWILPLLEWLVYFCTLVWFLMMALLM